MEIEMNPFKDIDSSSLRAVFSVGFLPRLFVATAIVVFFYVAWRVTAKLLLPLLEESIDRTAGQFIKIGLRYAFFVMGAITALEHLGVSMRPLLAGLGIVGLTLGFAAKEILGNAMSGLTLLWDRPYSIGDVIQLNGQLGTVESISLRSTRVVTSDGRVLAIPNQVIMNSTVASFSAKPELRLDIEFPVPPREDVGCIRKLVVNQVSKDARLRTSPEPNVIVSKFGEDYVLLQLQVWVEGGNNGLALRAPVQEQIVKVLREANIPLALTKHFYEDSKETMMQ